MSSGKIVICITVLNILIYGSNLTLNRVNKIKRPAIFAEAYKNLAQKVWEYLSCSILMFPRNTSERFHSFPT